MIEPFYRPHIVHGGHQYRDECEYDRNNNKLP
jgi:hypothetical protein